MSNFTVNVSFKPKYDPPKKTEKKVEFTVLADELLNLLKMRYALLNPI